MDNRNGPLISVIIPVYNAEKYLPVCLDSLLAQTYPNLELVCVNDGSPDGSQAVLERYARQDSRVKVFCKENGGVSAARNFGMRQAQGKYISFVDADDFVTPQHFAHLLAAAVENDAPLVVCGCRNVPEHRMKQVQQEPVKQEPAARITPETYEYGGFGSCSQCIHVLYRRELLEPLSFRKDLYIGEDALFFLQAFLRAGCFIFLPEKTYLYRIREDSSYKKAFTMRQYTEVTAWEEIVKLTREQPERMKRSAEGGLLCACARVYYRMHDAGCEPALQKKLIREARTYRKAYRWLPIHNRWEKGRVLTLLYCPWLGALVWNTARKIQKQREKNC